MGEMMKPSDVLANMDRILEDHPPEIARLIQIRDTLALILHYQERRMFFPIVKPDGSISYVNLAQAVEINRISAEQCQIILVNGRIIEVTTKEGVDAVIQSIQKEVVSVEDLPKAPR